jgi:signal transduction histidine kinase
LGLAECALTPGTRALIGKWIEELTIMISAPVSQRMYINGINGRTKIEVKLNPHNCDPQHSPAELVLDRAYLEKVLEISRRMAEIEDLDTLLNYAIDEAITLVGAERGYVVLGQSESGLKVRVKRSEGGQELEENEDHISTSIFYKVVSSGEALVLNDAQSDPRFDGARSVINLKLRSIMCVPLITKGETIGAIYVENRSFRNRFTEDNLPPLTLFANQAAVVIENAMLIDTLEERVAARTRQVEESWFKLVEANQLRTVWLSNITHDLRTPLAVATTALTLIQKGEMGDLNDIQREWIGKSLAATQHSMNLVNDLLYLSKLEAGVVAIQPEKVDLKVFLKDIYDVALGLPWEKEVAFSLSMLPRLPELAIDPLRIRQVVLNLLSNAQKFTRQGRVTLYVAQRKHDIVIGVQDTGPGIPASKIDRLFQRFQQLDDTPDHTQQGSGLGLAICRELIELHGGRIWVESVEGEGSNFLFSLPLDPGPQG